MTHVTLFVVLIHLFYFSNHRREEILKKKNSVVGRPGPPGAPARGFVTVVSPTKWEDVVSVVDVTEKPCGTKYATCRWAQRTTFFTDLFIRIRNYHEICHFQPCSEPIDFREHQCAAYNDSPYDDQYLRWSAHYDENEPCALTCRGSPVEESKKKTGEEPAIIVQLASKVQDGTRCRPGSLDMCVSGKCLVSIISINQSSNQYQWSLFPGTCT